MAVTVRVYTEDGRAVEFEAPGPLSVHKPAQAVKKHGKGGK